MTATTIIPLLTRRDDEEEQSQSDSKGAGRGIPIRAISRAILVLQAINRSGALSMMEIANEANIPYPTACRIVQTLLHEELIEREEGRKKYRPTALVQTLSLGYSGHGELLQAAHSHIVELTRRIGWPISVMTHVGSSMVLRDSTHKLTSLTFNEYHPGYALPILTCASGLVHLAFCDVEERETILSHLPSNADDESRHMLKMIQQDGELENILRKGYAARGHNRFTRNPGMTSSIAVPLICEGEIQAVLTVAFFAATIDMRDAVRDILPHLKGCADNIVASLMSGEQQIPAE